MSQPKIELVRLSSAERRSLPPLNFVQLCVKYTHQRMESYAGLVARGQPPPAAEQRCPKCVKRRRACPHLTDAVRAPTWSRPQLRSAVKSLGSVVRADARAGGGTKSCENVPQVGRQPQASDGRRRSPLAWCEATRSEEHLADPLTATPRDMRGAKSHEHLRKYTIDGSGELVPLGLGTISQSVPGSPHGFWNKKSNTMPNMHCGGEPPPASKPRRTLTSFLKRLHPRLLRATLGGPRAAERRPWIVVEFQDVDSDRTSVSSTELRDRQAFSSASKISLVKSWQPSHEELADHLLDAKRQGRVKTLAPKERTPFTRKSLAASEARHVSDPAPSPNGIMFSEKEAIQGSELTSTRIIMDAQKELRTNGCGQDQVDRAVVNNMSQRLLQETHTLKTSMKSSEVVKQAVRLLSEEQRNGAASQKRPSYVGISCSVSGYSNLNRYPARVRDVWSRESSPARVPRSLSRDSSPPGGVDVRPAGGAIIAGPSRVSQIKQQLRDGFQLADGDRGRDGQRAPKRAEQSRSLSVDRGYLRQARLENARLLNGTSDAPASPPVNGYGRAPPLLRAVHVQRTVTTVDSNGELTHAAHMEQNTDGVVSRSFVQARIERLYGPGALCSGFRRLNLNRSLPNRTASADAEPAPRRPPPLQLSVDALAPEAAAPPASPGLPVFRHLRPEFRQQLPVKAARVRPPPPADTSPTQTAVPPITAADPPLIRAGDCPLSEPDPQRATAHPEKPGHRFLKVLDAETTRILALATKAENDLNARTLSPEIEGKLRAAKGKANLLIAQKFQQFRGLCEKNIKPPADDPFPTTGDDLQGFWDMVLIQVHHINAMMDELDAIRANNWQLPEATPPPELPSSASSTPNSKSSTSSRRSAPTDPAKAEAARARSVARKKMIEQRRRLMEEKRRAARSDTDIDIDDVQIYTPEGK